VRNTSGSVGAFGWGVGRGVRTRAALVAVATFTGLLVAPTGASGVVVTCQGLPATIVAAGPNVTTTGTEGDDVIVGQRDAMIDALGGADVICVGSGQVAGGDGNDSVLVTGTDPEKGVSANLGAGDDRYVGGPGWDVVDGLVSPSLGSDNISTGAGRDTVSSGAPGEANHDVVDAGDGDDWMNLTLPPGSAAQVRAGPGPDNLGIYGASADHLVDLGTGVVTSAGVELATFSDVEKYRLQIVGPGTLRVLGSPGRDRVSLADAERVELHLGGGRDQVTFDGGLAETRVPVSGVVDLGPGKDYLQVLFWHRVVADLVRGGLVLANSSRNRMKLGLLGVENVTGHLTFRAVMRGGSGANQLLGYGGCHLRISGGAGADQLTARSKGGHQCGASVAGGAGRDFMSGGSADDRLLGGQGQDVAFGGQGIDTCLAERETDCER
jgi:Ca2+-binding RTX toxin-like protein